MSQPTIRHSGAKTEIAGACPIEIAAQAPNILRIRIGAGPFDPAASYLPPERAIAALPLSVDGAVALAGGVAFEVKDGPLALDIRNAAGAVPLRLRLSGLDLSNGLRLPLEFIGEQHFYGLGGAGNPLDRLGVTRRFWNSHVNHGQGADISIPLLISSAGYGLFFDHSGVANLDPGDSNDDVLADYSCAAGQVDIYYLGGSSIRETLALAADLLGHAPMPPRWALGYLQSTRHFDDTAELLGLAEGFRSRDIPCDGIVLLSTYSDQRGWNAGVGHLTCEPTLLPDPAPVFSELKDQGFRIITHEYAVVHKNSPLYREAEAKGFCLDDGYATIVPTTRPLSNYLEGQRYIDFSREDARRWWWSAHDDLLKLGVDGWWLDGGEGPAATTGLAAGSGATLHNRFDLLRQQAFAEGEAKDRPEGRAFMLCRSGGAGMQRFGAACWSGDVNNTFPTLAAQVPTGLNMGLSGVPYWGTDIGGYYATVAESDELFVRWFQYGAFCPIFRAHGRDWRRHTPWGRGAAIEAICRAFIELRYQLMPYIYTLAWQAHRDGLPLIRPLVLDREGERVTWDLGDQFLLGDDILVAPVTQEGARSRPVRLPIGIWHDYWTGKAYRGPATIIAEAPLETIPVFLRGGTPLPLAPVVQHDSGPTEEVTLLIHPSTAGSFTLYDDDTASGAYRQGAYALTRISCAPADDGVRVSIAAPEGDSGQIPARRRYRLRIAAATPPETVTASGGGTGKVELNWQFDAAGFVLVEGVRQPAQISLVWPARA
ncbi:TIM-barrel domain-containing protein [Bosea sp. BK604]|uniref:glycoside hydrolase family 31 protein n=1 Tax=Bosea sp. BK604 TaxID=2512180 RepID=UPI00104EED65|nr:TIM-barrel domain-containing protein [Bosea sp. BK604]TCR64764.1 alpha-glucosidase/alpha-D-xyloside xylohydrolase [Bosea sp. BK604]